MPVWVDWIFTAVSGACAVYSFLQARKCGEYASRAEIFASYDCLSEIRASCRNALTAIEPFGLAASPDAVRGRVFANDIEPVKTHLRVLRDHGHVLDEDLLESHCRTIQDELSQAEGREIAAARVIYRTLSAFQTKISKQKDAEKKEILK